MKTRVSFVALFVVSLVFLNFLFPSMALTVHGMPQNTATVDDVMIAGPTIGTINTAYQFVASVLPITVTTPITYVWQATGQTTAIHTGRLAVTDTVTFAWNATGEKPITVTATSMSDTVTHSYTVTIRYHTVYLPLIANRWPPIPYTAALNAIDNADQDNNYILYWTEQPFQLSDTYIVQEATDTTFTTGVRTVCTTWQQSCAVANQLPGTYYYRVKGYNTWGNSGWSNVRSTHIYPLFVRLSLRWDGNGYIRGSEYYDIGYHLQRVGNGLTDADTIRIHSHEWFDPDPEGWGPTDWDSYYSISAGYFKSSSIPGDPSWKWSDPWIMPYDWQLRNGQTFLIDGQAFRVSGPFSGYTAFGKPVQYWQLVNRDRFLFWSAGGDWTQYVHAGDITLRYDAGNTRLEIYSSILRHDYHKGQLTSNTVQYIIQLTAANSFLALIGYDVNPSQYGEVTTAPVEIDHRNMLTAGRLR
jgi:hypothetical protein